MFDSFLRSKDKMFWLVMRIILRLKNNLRYQDLGYNLEESMILVGFMRESFTNNPMFLESRNEKNSSISY